jgi:acyl-coenzyme A thioesterase PaaI-like protein
VRKIPASTGAAIRRRVASALAANRLPGFHFPGYLLGLEWPRIGADNLRETMPDGPHCRSADGTIALSAFSVLLDTALATAPRLKIKRGVRQATVHLHAQFTGRPLQGALSANARLESFSAGGAVREAQSSAKIYAGGKPVCHAMGSFVVLPPPAGVKLAPLPWQSRSSAAQRPLDEADFDVREAATMAACDAALERADERASFIEHFWGTLPRETTDGARCRVRLGPQHGNRVGHVQGGLLLGLAAVTAQTAAPRHPRLSAISAWFISPGQGHSLKVRSERYHEGRSFAGIRTEVRNADGTRVLEVVSHHAA